MRRINDRDLIYQRHSGVGAFMTRPQPTGFLFRDTVALNFDGANDYAYKDDPSWKTDTQGCFAIWYRPATVRSSTGLKDIMGYGTTSAGNDSMWVLRQRYNGSSTINASYRSQPIIDHACRISHAGTNNLIYGNHILVAGTTVLWVIQSNGTTTQHGINGSLLTTTAWNSTTNAGDWLGDVSGTNHRLVFGCQWSSNTPSNHSDCRLNEVLYINRPLTGGEVTELYNSGTPRHVRSLSFRADVKSWWRFGDRNSNPALIPDRIGSNHLTTVSIGSGDFGTP